MRQHKFQRPWTFPVMSMMAAASTVLLGSMLLKRNHHATRLRR